MQSLRSVMISWNTHPVLESTPRQAHRAHRCIAGRSRRALYCRGGCLRRYPSFIGRHCRGTRAVQFAMGPTDPQDRHRGVRTELAGAPSWPLRPQHVIRDLHAVLNPDDLVLCDVGAHKLWMARMFPCEVPNSCIISNGFAAMGIAVPGAIAAKLWSPERRVIAVTGDAGFLMNSQELETAVRLGLPLVILVWRDDGVRGDLAGNNRCVSAGPLPWISAILISCAMRAVSEPSAIE